MTDRTREAVRQRKEVGKERQVEGVVEQVSKGVKRGSQEVTEVEREWGREREREGGERRTGTREQRFNKGLAQKSLSNFIFDNRSFVTSNGWYLTCSHPSRRFQNFKYTLAPK